LDAVCECNGGDESAKEGVAECGCAEEGL